MQRVVIWKKEEASKSFINEYKIKFQVFDPIPSISNTYVDMEILFLSLF